MAKPAITKRAVKAAALTYAELDTNFQNIVDATITLRAGTGGTNVTADLNGTITLVAGTNVTLTGDNSAKTVTINSTAAGSGTVDTGTSGRLAFYPSTANLVDSSQLATTGSSLGTTVTLSAENFGGTLKLMSKNDRTSITLVDDVNGNITLSPNGVGRVIANTELNVTDGYSPGIGINLTAVRIEASGALSIGAHMTFGGSVSGPRINMDETGAGFGSIIIGKGISPDDKVYLDDVVNINNLTSTQRAALTNPQNGDMFYNTTTNKFQGYANGAWVDLH
jgi:hypothetical protein